MSTHPTDDGGSSRSVSGMSVGSFDLEELRRRNRVAVGMDVLYLVTTGFFAHMLLRGLWPAVIAAAPMAAFLYFGWSSSKPFFAAQVLTVAITAAATVTNAVPL